VLVSGVLQSTGATQLTGATVWTTPYRAAAYRNAAWVTPLNAYAVVGFDTIEYDLNNSFDITTHVGRYTCPFAGFYLVLGSLGTSNSSGSTVRILSTIYKNGVEFKRGNDALVTTSNFGSAPILAVIRANPGDYIEVAVFASGNINGTTGPVQTWMAVDYIGS
jgi:hypothetical protein